MKRPPDRAFTITPVEHEVTPDRAAAIIDFAQRWVRWRDGLLDELRAAVLREDIAAERRIVRQLCGKDEADQTAA